MGRKDWTPDEMAKLVSLMERGYTRSEVASRLGRTRNSVRLAYARYKAGQADSQASQYTEFVPTANRDIGQLLKDRADEHLRKRDHHAGKRK